MEEIKDMTLEEVQEVSLDELGEAAGGRKDDDRHDLSKYTTGTVKGLARGSYLYMKKTAGGANMNVKFKNGDKLLYDARKKSSGYYLAFSYQAQKYGYVEAAHIK